MKHIKLLAIVMALVICTFAGVGYAQFSHQVSGDVTANAQGSFALKFDGTATVVSRSPSPGSGYTFTSTLTNSDKTLTINLNGVKKADRSIRFSVPVLNNSTIDALVTGASITNVGGSYWATISTVSGHANGDRIAAGTTQTVVLELVFPAEANFEPSTVGTPSTYDTFSITLQYEQDTFNTPTPNWHSNS
ncbi:MAG: hypothetical protein LBS74_10880 [Oscillospiraceae bacterium]|jgi:hypothetical protein|nr:hypothetical protein [Oscillospiraceae bacterium]